MRTANNEATQEDARPAIYLKQRLMTFRQVIANDAALNEWPRNMVSMRQECA